MRGTRGPTPVATTLAQLLRQGRAATSAGTRLAAAFAAAAGGEIAAAVRVRGARAGRLRLETASPAMLAELRGFRAAGILARWPVAPPTVPPIHALDIRLAGR